MFEWLMRYWLEVVFGVFTAGLGFAVKTLWKKIADNNRRQDAIEKGIQALLRDRIVQAYYNYSDRGSITLHGMENVERMYEEYRKLGGNGTVTKLVEDLRELQVRNEKPACQKCNNI